MSLDLGTPIDEPDIEAMRVAYLYFRRLSRAEQLAGLQWLASRLEWDASQPPEQNSPKASE